MSDQKPIPRREFIRWAAASTASCAAAMSALAQPSKPSAPKDPEKNSELYDILHKPKDAKNAKAFAWIDQSDEERIINLKALEQAKLKGKYVTLSFGFAKCQGYCTDINARFKALHKINPDLVYVIVGVDPETDGTKEGRKAFLKRIMTDLELKEDEKDKVILLFAVKTDEKGELLKDKNGHPQFVPTDAPQVQLNAGVEAVNLNNPRRHTPTIYLFGKSGEKLAEKSGTRPLEEFKDWETLMPKEKTKEAR